MFSPIVISIIYITPTTVTAIYWDQIWIHIRFITNLPVMNVEFGSFVTLNKLTDKICWEKYKTPFNVLALEASKADGTEKEDLTAKIAEIESEVARITPVIKAAGVSGE